MYKVASDRRQSALSRGRLSDWITPDNRMSLDEQYRQVKEGMAIIEARISVCTDPEDRKNLGLQKQEMQAEAERLRKAIHGERRSKDGLAQFIVDAAKEILTPSQFDLIYRTANRMWEQNQALSKSALDANLPG